MFVVLNKIVNVHNYLLNIMCINQYYKNKFKLYKTLIIKEIAYNNKYKQ